MKTKRFRIVLAMVIVAMVGGAGWHALRPREPVYQGKPISYWIDRSGRISVVGNQNINDFAFPQLDSNAVPFLAQALQRRDGRSRVLYFAAWQRSPLWLRRGLPRPSEGLRVRLNVIQELGELGKDAIPVLARALKEDGDPFVRVFAALSLGKIDAQDKIVRGALMGACNDKDFHVRAVATNFLGKIDPGAAAKAGVK